MGFVLAHARRHKIPTALASLVAEQFAEARSRYGGEAQYDYAGAAIGGATRSRVSRAGFPCDIAPPS